MAHVDLAKAEVAEIGGRIARAAALIGAAIGLLIMVSILLIVGPSLFLGEWLLGSIGWGVLHGTLAFLAVALACVVAAVGVAARRIGVAFLAALAIAALVAILLAFALPNRLYASIGDAAGPGIEAGVRPLVVGVVLVGVIGLVIGIIGAIRARASVVGAGVGGLIGGAVVGALTAVHFQPQVGAGIGITVGYLAWMGILGSDVARTGIDTEGLKARFYPTQTIETSKETLEWLQKRMPPGIG